MSVNNESNISQILNDVDFVNKNAASFKKLSQQLSTGRRHAHLRDYGTLVSKLISLQSVISQHESYIRSIELVDFNIKAFQNSLEEIEQISRQAEKAASETAPNVDDPVVVARWRNDVSSTSRLLLEQLETVLNTQIAGKYIFAGNRFNAPAVKDLGDLPTLSAADARDPRYGQYQTENNLPAGAVHFAVGENSKTIQIRVSPDTDPDTFIENLKVKLDKVTPVGTTTASTILEKETIVQTMDEDTHVSIENLGPRTVAEGHQVGFVIKRQGGNKGLNLPINLRRFLGQGMTAADITSIQRESGGALTTLPFTGDVQRTIIPLGQDSIRIWVNVAADAVKNEGTESFSLQIDPSTQPVTNFFTDASYTIDPSAGVASAAITDTSDTRMHLTIERVGDLKFDEGNGTTTQKTFRVRRANHLLADGPQTVKWSIDFENSEANELDFRGGATSGEVIFAEGEDFKDIVINVNSDNIVESDEMFQVKIEGEDVAQSHAMSVIGNDEVSFSVLPQDANKVEGGRHTFVVRRDGDASVSSSVVLNSSLVSGGTTPPDVVTVGTSVRAPTGTTSPLITFAPGETEVLVTFISNASAADDTMRVSLSSPIGDIGGGAVGATISTTQNIAEGEVIDDIGGAGSNTVSIDLAVVNSIEGDNGLQTLLNVTVTRTDTNREEYVSYSTEKTNMDSMDSDDFTRGHGVMPSYIATDALGARQEVSYIFDRSPDDRDAEFWKRQNIALRDGQSRDYGTTAANQAFQKLIKGLVLLRSTTEARNADHVSTMLEQARNMLRDSTADVRHLVAENSVTVNGVTAARKVHTSFGALAKNQLGDVRDVDAAEAAAKLTSLQSMVNASYSLIAKRAKLSLANFL